MDRKIVQIGNFLSNYQSNFIICFIMFFVLFLFVSFEISLIFPFVLVKLTSPSEVTGLS